MTEEALLNLGKRERKHPWLAVLMSQMFPGAGHIYSGARGRGIFFIASVILLLLIVVIALFGFLFTESATTARKMSVIVVSLFLAMSVLSIYALFDAYKLTNRYNAEYVLLDTAGEKRKPWLAAFLSAILPGLGQFYNRQVLKGFAFISAIIFAYALEKLFILLFIIPLLVYLTGIKDAFDSAQSLNGSSARFFQQKRTIVNFLLIMLSLQAIPFAEIIKNHVIEAFKMPSGSMYPTLEIGDHFLIGKSGAFRAPLRRGDVVVFPYPENPKKLFVKRVIGLGGDKVQFINGELYINEQSVSSKKLDVQEDDHLWLNTIGPPTVYEERIGDATYRVQYLRDKSTTNGGPWRVPQDSVFVLGDNRDNSMDSRVWGSVKRDGVKGKAMKKYWSWDRVASRVRWERIGETIH